MLKVTTILLLTCLWVSSSPTKSTEESTNNPLNLEQETSTPNIKDADAMADINTLELGNEDKIQNLKDPAVNINPDEVKEIDGFPADVTASLLSEPGLQRRFAGLIERSLEELLGKAHADMKFKTNAEIQSQINDLINMANDEDDEVIKENIKRTVNDPIVSEENTFDLSIDTVKNTTDTLEKEIGTITESIEEESSKNNTSESDKDILRNVEGVAFLETEKLDSEIGDSNEHLEKESHSLQKKDVSSNDHSVTDKLNNLKEETEKSHITHKSDEVSTQPPETVIELMNRLKEEMANATLQQLAPVIATVNNLTTLAGRSDMVGQAKTIPLPLLPVVEMDKEKEETIDEPHGPVPCTCGVFLSGQFKKGSKDQPKGVPVLTQEMDTPFLNNVVGNRQCTNKCLELIIKHLPKSSEIICSITDRDRVYKEKAYLFIKNWTDKWTGTNLSAGREFCCKDNVPYKCPMS